MQKWLLTDMSWEITPDEAKERLHITEDDEEDFDPLFQEVYARLHPCIYYGRAEIHENDGHRVLIEDQWFESRILAVNLKDSCEVYPYIMTSGREAYEYGEAQDDFLLKYWTEQICEIALKRAGQSGMRIIKERLGNPALNTINPGSLANWPINEQKPLFALFGDVREATGVELTPSFLMLPVKSGSGIMYASEEHYANCMLCPRISCPNRRAPYQDGMFEEKYGE